MQLKRRTQYSWAFKRHAVNDSLKSDQTLAAVADNFGIHRQMLSRWRAEMVSEDRGQDSDGIPNEGPELSRKEIERENRRLKKQLEKAKLELEILKKADEYFAKHQK